jgi:hypothetical protein
MWHKHFYVCLDDKLAHRVRSAATATSAMFNPNGSPDDPTSLQTLLTKQFNDRNTIFTRRYRFFGKLHPKGVKLSDWYNKLCAEGDECDLAGIPPICCRHSNWWWSAQTRSCRPCS